jgi:hypothetical protein
VSVQLDDWRRSCQEKKPYSDEVDALTACAQLFNESGYNVWPYRCRHCESFHVGHTPLGVRRFIAMFLEAAPIVENQPRRQLTHSLGEAMKNAKVIQKHSKQRF